MTNDIVGSQIDGLAGKIMDCYQCLNAEGTYSIALRIQW